MVVTGLEVHVICEVLIKCVKIYNIIDHTVKEYKSAPKDIEELTLCIHIEIIRIRELTDVLFVRGMYDLLRPDIQGAVLGVFKRLLHKLDDYGIFVAETGLGDDNSAKSTSVTLSQGSSAADLVKAIDDVLTGKSSEFVSLEEQEVGRWKRLKWMVSGHKKLDGFADDIHNWAQRFLSSLPTLIMSTAGLDMDKLKLLSDADERYNYLPGLGAAAKLAALSITQSEPKRSPLNERFKTPPEEVGPIDPELLEDVDSENESNLGHNLEFMVYDDRKVIVQTLLYPTGVRGQGDTMKNIGGLAELLRNGAAEKLNELNVLKCIGYLHDYLQDQNCLQSRLFFEVPLSNGREADLIPLSGLIRMQTTTSSILGTVRNSSSSTSTAEHADDTDDVTVRHLLVPGLDEKFKLAQALARSIALLHAARWLHKSIRGDTIVFLDFQEEKVDYTKPYLVGFEYSRRQDRESGPLPGKDWRNDIYRHPKRQGQPTEGFKKKHDYYALGVVLVEIGYWQNLMTLGKFPEYAEYRSGVETARKQRLQGVNENPTSFKLASSKEASTKPSIPLTTVESTTPERPTTPSGQTALSTNSSINTPRKQNPLPGYESVKDELIRLVEAEDFRHKVGKVWKEVTLRCLKSDFGVEEVGGEESQLQSAFQELVVNKLMGLSA